MKCGINLKVGQVRSKIDQILENPFFTLLRSKSFILIFMKLFQNVNLYESRGSLRLGQIGLSTRSLGQMVEKSCIHSKRHSFDLIFINSQNINLHGHVQHWVILGRNIGH